MKTILTILLILVSQLAYAITFHAQISSEQNAPSAAYIVNQSLLSPPPPIFILQAFNAINPEEVDYLIRIRAIGNLRTIMDNNPGWERAELQQYLVLAYPDDADVAAIQASLDNDPFVASAYQIDETNLPTLSVPYPDMSKNYKKTPPLNRTITTASINNADIQSAWELSEGMGYVGIADTGLQTNHPDLRAFDGSGNYVGGNLLDGFYQIDFAKTSGIDLNVDELEPVAATASLAACDGIDGDPNDGLTVASFVGHGTHVAGLIGAKGNTAPGICKNCGISMMKFYGTELGSCFNVNGTDYLFAGFSYSAYLSGWETLANIGVGTINLSAGDGSLDGDACTTTPLLAECLILKLIEDNQILFTGAAGNNRTNLQFPASDNRTAAAG
ncbi:MAG: S8 family serine peptidase, partial [Xanthomonadales bacterium]|nr:S8 family serine peptidase [Xanthomonadales bacterium]